LANAVNYDVQTIKEIAIGALLHDIGFIFIPKDIIEKDESELNEEEMSIRQNHCNLGIMTMKSANIPFRSQKIIEQHHEKLDGTGYPNGLNVRDILEEAHIVSIAEELDMRTSYFQGGATEIGEVIQDMVNLPEKFSRKYTELLKSIFEV
jgi:HD-GYP domain-containing protein (c-di-GMP phosphodiesterase class II)